MQVFQAFQSIFTPVKAKTALVTQLREAIAQTTTFCTQKGIDFAVLESAQGFACTKFWADAVECIIINNDAKKTYLSLTGNANKFYKVILPDAAAIEMR